MNEYVASIDSEAVGYESVNDSVADVASSADEPWQLHDTVLECIEQGIMVWSPDGVCQFLNSRYFELLELSVNDVYVGLSRHEHLLKSVDRGEMTYDQLEAVEADYLARKSFWYDRRVGDDKIVMTMIRPTSDGGHVVSFTDVTESRNAVSQLETAMLRAEQAEHRAQQALESIKVRQNNTDNLAELSDWLQSCKSIDELFEIVRQAVSNLFPGSSGQLFVYSNSRDVLDGAVCWGDQELMRNIQPQDCWSLRRGRVFCFGGGVVNIPCNHVQVDEHSNSSYLCLPIIAHGDTVGLLHIQMAEASDSTTGIDSLVVSFATRCAEQISIALANVRLRDQLHEQSTRDPLTGLYNRRHFQELCRAELARSVAERVPLSVVVFDADNFKNYNDRYGHDAGDKVLSTLSDVFRRCLTEEELVSRIGGEEFALMLPGTTATQATARAEQLLMAITERDMEFHNSLLPNLTVSAGVATCPDHGSDLYELLRKADLAMYDAKDAGKNCVRAHSDAS